MYNKQVNEVKANKSTTPTYIWLNFDYNNDDAHTK